MPRRRRRGRRARALDRLGADADRPGRRAGRRRCARRSRCSCTTTPGCCSGGGPSSSRSTTTPTARCSATSTRARWASRSASAGRRSGTSSARWSSGRSAAGRRRPATTSCCCIDRKGFLEETHFRVAYSPVPDDDRPADRHRRRARHRHRDHRAGVRRAAAPHAARARRARQRREATTAEQACADGGGDRSPRTPGTCRSRSSICSTTAGGARARRPRAGFDGATRAAAPAEIELVAPATRPGRSRAGRRRAERPHRDRSRACRGAAGRPVVGAAARSAIVLPLASPDQARAYGVLVCGVSPHRALDAGYRTFFELAAAQVVTAIRNARALRGRSASAPRRWPSSTAPRPRSSPTSATSSARRSR